MKASDLPKGKLIKMSGVGSFQNKLNRGIHTTGQLHTLHDNQKAVEKLGQLVSSQKRYIRGHGQFIYKGNRNTPRATANNNGHAITSIANKFTTATVRRSGDKTILTEQGQERAHIFGSIGSAIKNKPASSATNPAKPSASNPNFKLRN